MIKGEIRVHIVSVDRPLNTKTIAREIVQQMRKGKLHNDYNDGRTEIRRGA